MELDPDNNPVKKAMMLTPLEKTKMFQDIINEYGSKGWKLVGSSPLSAGGIEGPFYFIFEKEIYVKKTG
jgi:hypothetical protein